MLSILEEGDKLGARLSRICNAKDDAHDTLLRSYLRGDDASSYAL
jgi:flagellar basal body P-ring protein FlgI